MAYVSSGKNCFRWPAKDGILTYELEDIMAVIDLPVQIHQHHFGINESQFAGLPQYMNVTILHTFEFVFRILVRFNWIFTFKMSDLKKEVLTDVTLQWLICFKQSLSSLL